MGRVIRIVLPLFLLIAGLATDAVAATAPADTVAPGGTLLRRLQTDDEAFFPDELLRFDAAFKDSLLGELDSLGFEAFEAQAGSRSRRFDLDFRLADRLFDYNRVEGLVAGGGLTLRPRGSGGPSLDLEGAYATGSRAFRHLEALTIPVYRHRSTEAGVRVGYGDRVSPFGASSPFANPLRTVIGAADDRDYLRRRGGWAGIGVRRGSARLRLAYEAARETTVGIHEDFSLFGRLSSRNLAVDEGIDRAGVVTVGLGSLAGDRAAVEATHRVAGGGFGGDFTYTRTDLSGAVRRYVDRHELVLEVDAALTGGDPTVQRAADVGGLGSVRGFDRRTRVGERSVAGTLEVLVPYDLLGATGIPGIRDLRLQLVPWGDAGRVWNGNAETWISSAGLGVQYLLGPFGPASYIRFDVAAPLGPDRPDDVRFYLRFSPGLF